MTSIPSVPASIDPESYQFLSAVKMALDASQVKSATKQDLLNVVNSIQKDVQNALDSMAGSLPSKVLDTVAPETPLSPEVSGGVLYNYLRFDFPSFGPAVDHINIYRSIYSTTPYTVNASLSVSAELIGTSQTNVYADYIPSGVNTLFYYWLSSVSVSGIESVLTGPYSASPLGINDSQLDSISATKVIALELSAISSDLGSIKSGLITSPDYRMVIDLVNNKIQIADQDATAGSFGQDNIFTPGSYAGGNYIEITNGEVITYSWNGATHTKTKALQTIESGVVASGATVVLNNFYLSTPKIIVSPSNIKTYNASNSNQDQVLVLTPGNIISTGNPGKYQFTPLATLNFGNAVSTVQTVNSTVTNTVNTAINSAEYLSNPNTTSFNINVSVNSIRGNGTTSYFRRKVSVRIRYGTVSGVYPNSTPAQVVDLGADINPNNATLSFINITAGTYYFVVEYTATDVTPSVTFPGGGATYLYGPDITVNLLADSAVKNTNFFDNYGNSYTSSPPDSWVLSGSFSTPTLQAGYSAYSVTYSLKGNFIVSPWNRMNNNGFLGVTGTGSATILNAATGAFLSVNGGASIVQSGGTVTWTEAISSFTPTRNLLSASITNSGYAGAQIFQSGSTAVIKQRKLNANSTTPSNTFTLVSYYFTLGSGNTPVTGELNYIAIG